jgi:hypothetical protein
MVLFLLGFFILLPFYIYAADTLPPVINSVSITPDTINDGSNITVTVNAVDVAEYEYISGINKVICNLTSPSGNQKITNIQLSYLSGDNYTSTVNIPEYVEPGIWSLSSVTLIDCAYNVGIYFDVVDYSANFTVNSGTPDTTPPLLGDISVEPYIVDDGSTLTVTINGIVDDISGVESVVCTIRSFEVDHIIRDVTFECYDVILGSYGVKQFIPKYVKSGYWKISSVKITDKALNKKVYEYAEDYTGGVFIVNSEEDTEPPQIANVSVSPTTVDLEDDVTVTLNAFDNKSSVKLVEVHFLSPTGLQQYTIPVDYSPSQNLYIVNFHIETWHESGIWKASYIRAVDDIGNEEYYYHGIDYHSAFAVNSDWNTEELPPGIAFVSLPANVDSGQYVTLSCNITDNLSGVAYAEAHFLSPSGKYSSKIPFVPKGGDLFESSLFIPEYVEDGDWKVNSIFVVDNVQNSETYYEGLDYNATFYVNSVYDVTPPQVSDVSLSTYTVNVTTTIETITVRCKVTDDLSGIYQAKAIFNCPGGSFYSYLSRVSGSTDTCEANCVIPLDVEKSTYSLSFYVKDNIYNYTTHSTTITLNVVSDITPPEISDVGSSTDTVNVISSPKAVTVSCKVTDDLSGVALVRARFSGPGGYWESYLSKISGDIYGGDCTITNDKSGGTYTLIIDARDRSNNLKILTSTVTLLVISDPPPPPPPNQPPVATNFQVSPGRVENGETVTIRCNVTDVDSGVNYVYAHVESPEGFQVYDVQLFYTPSTGFYEGRLTIPQFVKLGVWAVSYIFCKDNDLASKMYYNRKDYTLEFSVGYIEDLVPPELISLQINPSLVIAGTTIQFIVKATDTLAGIHEVKCTIYKPSGEFVASLPMWQESATESWIMYSSMTVFNFLAENGLWTVKTYLSDNALNEKTYSYPEDYETGVFTVVSDTIGPAGSISIDNGAQYISTNTVTLSIHAVDEIAGVYQMQFSNDDVAYTGWEAYTDSKEWSLIPGEGIRAVLVKLKDGIGNISGPYSDSITIDLTPPDSGIVVPSSGVIFDSLSAISGTSVDNCEVSKTELLIRNINNNLYWNGSNWISQECWLETKGINSWTYSAPDWSDNSNYSIVSRAVDKISNYQVTISSIAFKFIVLPEPVDCLSAVPLEGGKIKLEWEPSVSDNALKCLIYSDDGTGTVDYETPIVSLSHASDSYTVDSLVAGTEYKFAVRCMHIAGYIEENTNIVSATPFITCDGIKAAIKVPHTGHKVSGKRLTIIAEIIIGSIEDTDNVLFQYRPESSGQWLDIEPANSNHPNPDEVYPYFVHWDVSGLSDGKYNVRAVATDKSGLEDTAPVSITIIVDHINYDLFEDEENADGKYTKIQKIDNRKDNTVEVGDNEINDIIEIVLPEDSLDNEVVRVKCVGKPNTKPEDLQRQHTIEHYWEITLDNGQHELNNQKEATIVFPYKDSDNDGVIDGTSIFEKDIKVFTFDENTGLWEVVESQQIDYEKNMCIIEVRHFSYFAFYTSMSEDFVDTKVYPNPFKPSEGHTYIKFDTLPYGTDIHIYTIAGEMVWKKEDITGSEVIWDEGVNSFGHKLASGLYMCLLTDDIGDKRMLKLVILR